MHTEVNEPICCWRWLSQLVHFLRTPRDDSRHQFLDWRINNRTTLERQWINNLIILCVVVFSRLITNGELLHSKQPTANTRCYTTEGFLSLNPSHLTFPNPHEIVNIADKEFLLFLSDSGVVQQYWQHAVSLEAMFKKYGRIYLQTQRLSIHIPKG